MIDPTSTQSIDYIGQIDRFCISILIKNQTYDRESSFIFRFPAYDLFDIEMLDTVKTYRRCSDRQWKDSDQINRN
jgi:hypothetical protein